MSWMCLFIFLRVNRVFGLNDHWHLAPSDRRLEDVGKNTQYGFDGIMSQASTAPTSASPPLLNNATLTLSLRVG